MNKRHEYWINFINQQGIRTMAEVGVYRGHFARAIFENCPSIETYYMIDCWEYLPQYFGRPKKAVDLMLRDYREEALAITEPWWRKRIVIEKITLAAATHIPDEALDLVYIDASHTLRGIATDLISMYPKVRGDGFLSGDDCTLSIKWKRKHWEPVMVYPFVLYFAEALGHFLYINEDLKQFYFQKESLGLIEKDGRYQCNFKKAFQIRTILYHHLTNILPRKVVTAINLTRKYFAKKT